METGSRQRVAILTSHYRITGEIELLPGARLTDYLAESKEFIAITEARVWDSAGGSVVEAGFLNLNLSVVQMIMPMSEVKVGMDKAAG